MSISPPLLSSSPLYDTFHSPNIDGAKTIRPSDYAGNGAWVSCPRWDSCVLGLLESVETASPLSAVSSYALPSLSHPASHVGTIDVVLVSVAGAIHFRPSECVTLYGLKASQHKL